MTDKLDLQNRYDWLMEDLEQIKQKVAVATDIMILNNYTVYT